MIKLIIFITLPNYLIVQSLDYLDLNNQDILNHQNSFVKYNHINKLFKNDYLNEVPTNFTLEPLSKHSVKLKWSLPLKEILFLSNNKENLTKNMNNKSLISQYKIKYCKSNNIEKTELITLKSNIHSFIVDKLDENTEYLFRISAVFQNGNQGLYTDWKKISTFKIDLDETRVPEKPSGLIARAKSTIIYLTWSPPTNQSIKINGYTLNYGIGFPEIYNQELDSFTNSYTIKNVLPQSEYIISLKAFNKMGNGEPCYTVAKTLRKKSNKEDEDLEYVELNSDSQVNDNKSNLENHFFQSKSETANSIHTLNKKKEDTNLLPPLGVKVDVLSSNKVRISWIPSNFDKSTIKNFDDLIYMIRYNSLPLFDSNLNNRKLYRYLNTSDHKILIDDLKAFTKYEFAVKLMHNNKASIWSMSVVNTTDEDLPASAPRNLIVVPASNMPEISNLDSLDTNKILNTLNYLPKKTILNIESDNQEQNFIFGQTYSNTISNTLNKQTTMKRIKSAVGKISKYREKIKSNKINNRNFLDDDLDEELDNEFEKDVENLKTITNSNYIQKLNSLNEQDHIKYNEHTNKQINSNLDVQADLSAVSLSWQPAMHVNGELLGYLISYTKNSSLKTKDWQIHQVKGDQRSTKIHNLLPKTIYYFKAQVRNKKGLGPYSSQVAFKTMLSNSNVSINTLYMIIAIISSISLLLLVVISSLLCKSKRIQTNSVMGNNNYMDSSLSKRLVKIYLPNTKTSLNGTLKLAKDRDLQPPDLWINHDQIELNKLDKNVLHEELSINATPILRRMETFLGKN